MNDRGTSHRGAIAFTLALCALTPSTALAQETKEKPWRAQEAPGVPRWLRFGLEHRTRLEHLQHDFRATAPGNSRALSMRTLLSAELRFAPVVVGAELIDARAFATSDTPLNNTNLDPFDVLQAYAGLRQQGVFANRDALSLTAGRMTIDLGSRRLVSRNGFRNTINAFTGLELQWTSPEQHGLRAFAVMPVLRMPTDETALRDNRLERDRENTDALLWGVFFGSAPVAARVQLESYVLGYHERDGTDAPSSNRRLMTSGLRVLRSPAGGQFDFQLEATPQFGTSRASTKASDSSDLSHRALSLHLSGGYQFKALWRPRVSLQYDYASGDGDPKDKVNGRFDPLFGSRRSELGPTGLYGAFARSNISSPGVRLEVAPHRAVELLAAYRLYWLASSRDAWTTAGVRDNTGGSGSFVGHQVEGLVRWNLLGKTVVLETGAAYLVRGEFATHAPGSKGANPVFVYTQVTGRI